MAIQQPQQEIDVEALVVEFEQKLDRLKMLYEQYFMGIEKREPLVPLKDVVRVMRTLDQQHIRNTGLRYRYRSLVQKLNAYRTYWNRTLRAIDNGTYHRDVARMSRSLARKGISVAAHGRVHSPAEIERAVVEAVRSTTDEHPAVGAAPSASTKPDPPAAPAQPARPPAPLEPTTFEPINIDGEAPPVGPESETVASPLRAARAGTPRTFGPAAKTEVSEPPSAAREAAEADRAARMAAAEAEIAAKAAARTGAPGGVTPEGKTPAPPLTPRPTGPAIVAPQAKTQRPPGVAMPRPPGAAQAQASAPSLSDAEMQSIYRRFVRAKELCGEDTSSVKYETLAQSIRRQLPKLQAQSPGKQVEFQVVIREGRAILKAVPK